MTRAADTTFARAWAVTRADGLTLGFTDHDLPLAFEGITFAAAAGLSAQAIEATTGLSVDNAAALGVLTDAGISEADLTAGRYDGAEVRFWHVDWRDVTNRALVFRGTIGQITREGIRFEAELRGLSEPLNHARGRVFQRACAASLGDTACGFDTATPGFTYEGTATTIDKARVFRFRGLTDFEPGWFTHGQLLVTSGAATGLKATIKDDRFIGADRVISLWSAIPAPLATGDSLRLIAGCDKRMATCRAKFGNIVNFRGFPDIPGEDWLTLTPQRAGANTGGSLR